MKQAYFENLQDVIQNQIISAHSKVYVAVAWFTNKILFDELKNVLQRNVDVKVLIHDDILNRNEFGLDFGKLVTLGAEVRFSNSNERTMHNKFCIIDDLVITGSYNWTYHANMNRENILMIDEEGVVESYREEFDRLFDDAIPIPQPYEYLKWTNVKEEDFSELRRNIFRDVIVNNDENRELKRIKLINLNNAYKSGDTEELAKASALATEQHLRTIMDVLTSRSQDFTYRLWEENIVGIPCATNVDGYSYIGEWYYIPQSIKEDNSHREYINGILKTKFGREHIFCNCMDLNIYDEKYISTIKIILGTKSLSDETRKLIPDILLRIDKAKMFFYKFPSQMYNINQSKLSENGMPRLRGGINLFGIAKEIRVDEIVFHDGWDPNERGEKIMEKFFVKELS